MSNIENKGSGFILIEILVSVLLLSIGILFLINALSIITKSNAQVRNNQLAFLVIDNIYNQIYSGQAISPGMITLDNRQYIWDITVNNTNDGLKHFTVNVTSGKNLLSDLITLPHSIIDFN